MKRHLICFLAAFLAVISFGCSEDLGQSDDIELTIQLTMSSKANTRGDARPLEGVDAWQRVTAVRVYVFRYNEEDGKYRIYQPEYSDADGTSKTLDYINVEAFYKQEIYKENKFEQHFVVVKPKLPSGYYRLLAIGVDEDKTLFDIITTESTWDNVLKTIENSPITEEFFSGYSETIHVTSSADKNFISIEMCRCVAGVLLYVKNIPEKYEGKDVGNIKLILSGFSNSTDIVNRTWAPDAITKASDITLAEFSAADAKLETITHTDETKKDEYVYYAGRFLLPSNTGILTTTTDATLKLVFYDKNGDKIGSKRVVMIGERDNDNDYDYDYDYEDPELSVDKQRTHYNLLANHIYCIGFRSETKKEPIDLSDDSDEVKAQIIVYGSWQADVDIPM